MNSYDNYTEKRIRLLEEEIQLYKNFIERELNCRIMTAVESERKFDGDDVRTIHHKTITIPKSYYSTQY